MDEVCAAVLDACVGELPDSLAATEGTLYTGAHIEGRELDVGVLVADPALQRAHSIFRLHRLGPDHVGYLEVERHVLPRHCQ